MTLAPLCAICDADAAGRAGWSLVDLAHAFLAGGARFLQIRAKTMASGELLETAAAIAALAHAAGAVVIVNDRADIARLARADGVHVGQRDLAPASARALVGPRGIVGLSTHTPRELEAALVEPVDYVAIGPVFDTTTKATGYDAVGLARVETAAAAARAHRMRLVAIGGISLETAPAVLHAGADSVAVISDLLTGGDPEARVRAYLAAFRDVRPQPDRHV